MATASPAEHAYVTLEGMIAERNKMQAQRDNALMLLRAVLRTLHKSAPSTEHRKTYALAASCLADHGLVIDFEYAAMLDEAVEKWNKR